MAQHVPHSRSNKLTQQVRGENHYVDGKAAKRKKLLTQSSSGGAIRDRDGKVTQAGEFQSSEAPSGRVQPDRRWFGNTRVISQTALEHFRESLENKQHDPYSVVLKQNKLPMSLLEESKKVRVGSASDLTLIALSTQARLG